MKKLLKDQSGLSLVELIIAAALVSIVISGFAAASVSSGASIARNAERSASREAHVGSVEEKTHNQYAPLDSEGNIRGGGTVVSGSSAPTLTIGGTTTNPECYAYIERGSENGVNYNYAVYVRK